MTVAFDAFTNGGAGGFTHTPVGTPRGVLVLIRMQNATDVVTGVTYGGSAMSEVALSPLVAAGAEGGTCYGYFLGSSVPTGAQTCTISVSAGTARGTCYTLTAAADTEVVNTDTINLTGLTSGDITDTLALSGRTCFVAEAIWSATGGVTGVNPLSGWTARQETDEGSETNFGYSYDTIGSSDVTFGGTLTTNDDMAVLAVAVSEVAGDDGVTGTVAQTLPKLAQAAAGKETITGTVAQTLAKLAQAAAGDVVAEGVVGSVAQTLPGLSQAAAGDVVAPAATGTVAQTLARLVQAAAGTVTMAVEGVVAQILPLLAQQIIGVVRNPFTPSADQPITYGGGHDDYEARVRHWWDEIERLRAKNRREEEAEQEKQRQIEAKEAEITRLESLKRRPVRKIERAEEEIEEAEGDLEELRAQTTETRAEITRLEAQIRAEEAKQAQFARRRRLARSLLLIAANQ